MLLSTEQEGAYAVIFKSSVFPEEAIAARRGSPLLFGIKQDHPSSECINVLPASPATAVPVNGSDMVGMALMHVPTEHQSAEYFLASDAAAIVEHTRQVVFLEDADLLHISPSGGCERPHACGC